MRVLQFDGSSAPFFGVQWENNTDDSTISGCNSARSLAASSGYTNRHAQWQSSSQSEKQGEGTGSVTDENRSSATTVTVVKGYLLRLNPLGLHVRKHKGLQKVGMDLGSQSASCGLAPALPAVQRRCSRPLGLAWDVAGALAVGSGRLFCQAPCACGVGGHWPQQVPGGRWESPPALQAPSIPARPLFVEGWPCRRVQMRY